MVDASFPTTPGTSRPIASITSAAGLGGQLKTIIAKHPWVAAGFTANKSFKLVDFEAGILGAVVAAPPPAAVITPAVPAKPQAAKKAA